MLTGLLTTSEGVEKEKVPFITPFYNDFTPYQRSLCIAPNSLPSNDCFVLVLSYVCGRCEATRVKEFNRINRVANKLLKRSHIINAFTRSVKKIKISSWMDPHILVGSLSRLGQFYSIKLSVNIRVETLLNVLKEDFC